MTLAEDKRPEATLRIGFGEYALQYQPRIKYELTQHILNWLSICWSQIKSMPQAIKLKG
jgi:hypothetical protein